MGAGTNPFCPARASTAKNGSRNALRRRKFSKHAAARGNWKTERAQGGKCSEKCSLMPNANRAVLQVAIIKTETGVEKDFFHAAALRDFNLPRKEFGQHRNRVVAQIEIADFAGRFCPARTNKYGGPSCAATILKISFEPRSRSDSKCSRRLQTPARADFWSNRFRQKPGFFRAQFFDDGNHFDFCAASSARARHAERGFRADVNDVRALRVQKLFRAEPQFPPRDKRFRDYHESADKLTTPMMADCELK